jgi:hypothetical protein
MICGFCGYEFDENTARKGCGGCHGGCHSVHCPRCNYKNPQESNVARKLKSLFEIKMHDKGE